MLAEEVKKSTHTAEVVPVQLEPHPNADALSIIRVFGYVVCGRTADWQGVTKGVYIPPDSLVDVRRPEFTFLAAEAKADGRYRVKAKKLRGIVSFGLLVPAPDGAVVGDDVTELLGIEHYEPTLEHERSGGAKWFTGGEVASGPAVVAPKYDLDALRRYHHLFTAGEPVVVHEKLDGANARYCFADGEMHCGSRTEWKKPYPRVPSVEELVAKGCPADKAADVVARASTNGQKKNLWWDVLERTPELETFCRDNPGVVVYGEVFGQVNCIKYGLPEGNRFAAFDILKDGRFLNYEEARELGRCLPWAPVVIAGDLLPLAELGLTTKDYWAKYHAQSYDFDAICALAEGRSLVPGCKSGTMREGVVVRPLRERYDLRVGRVALKVVSGSYLEKYR